MIQRRRKVCEEVGGESGTKFTLLGLSLCRFVKGVGRFKLGIEGLGGVEAMEGIENEGVFFGVGQSLQF